MKKNYFFIAVLLAIFFSPYTVKAQTPKKIPTTPIVCPAKFEDMHTRVTVAKSKSKDYQLRIQESATAELLVTYGPGAQANPDAMAAFQFALDIWSNQIVSPVPIKIYADFANLGSGVLASAGPAYMVSDIPNAPDPNVLYPAALANAIAGEVLFPDEEFDLIVNLGNGIPWYFGTDGNTPSGLFDFVTVALHEAGHGLGFTAVRNYSGGVGSLRSNGTPSIFAIFMVDGDGNYLLDFPDPSVEIGDAFTGGDLYIDGAFSKAALGGERPELFAPPSFEMGSSIAHWDETAYPAGDPNSLMSPQVGTAEAIHDIGDITRGFFKDMGWVINDEEAPALIASPGSISEELFVGDGATYNIEVSNISDVTINALITSNTGSSTIEIIDPSELTIPSAGTDSFDVTINTTGLEKGVYRDTIYIEATETEDIITVPVTVQVLDGTEVPLISVSPESFNETIERLEVITRELTIQNSGDADLSYNISIEDGSTPDFETRVATTNNLIKAQGFSSKNFSGFSESTNKTALIKNTNNTFNEIITSLYATDFEEFVPGDINSQLGWLSQYENNWIISDANPADGSLHFRGISDGLGSTRTGNIIAISPTIAPLDEPYMVMSADVNIQGSGVTWEIIPQAPSEESVMTRLRFNPDRTIDVLSGSDFTPVNATIPEGYFHLKIVVDKDDSAFAVYFDNVLVFSGQGFAPYIEQVIFLSSMEVEGSTMDIDNLEVTDGDPDAFFLSVSPSAGVVPMGSSATVDVKFDSRILDAGEYDATIIVDSNDEVNSPINIPVTLTVLEPATIEVTPTSLSAAVNVQTDTPPIQVESFTISNTGESTLEFTSSLGSIGFTPLSGSNALTPAESLNMANYGEGNSGLFEEKLAGKPKTLHEVKTTAYQDAVTYSDSIAYDSGLPFPDDFAGLQTAAYTNAVNFDVENEFTLTAIRNGFRTEAIANPVVIVEIYKGGATPNEGELLLTQTFNEASEEGVVFVETLNQSLSFSAGESFWVVHKYPEGIEFPQGVDSNATQRPDTYFFSGDGGATYSPSGFVFFVRALSGGSESNYITLEPSSGTVEPGQSLNVSVTFNGENLANGTYNTDIRISSNDPVTPVETVATTFEVSGQVSEIAISDEFLLFNDVFIGAERERSFTINNNGLAELNITGITSDNPNFTVDVSSATIPAQESLEVTVTFAPQETGSLNGILTIESDAPENNVLEVIVNGVGVEPPVAVVSPQEVSLNTDAGTTIDTQITLSNEGNSPLIFSFPDLAVAAALAKPDVKLNNTEYISFKNFSTKQEKGYKDNRLGTPVLYSVGTDNNFGYSWIDSDEEGGPVYSFNDITSTGTEITSLMGGDGSTEVTLPFTFEFYGTTHSSILVNANGFLAFQPPSSFSYINDQIPVDDGTNNIIAGMWTDLEPQEFNGSVHYEDFGDRLVVQWTQATLYDGPEEEYVTFQIVLYDNGNIDVYYEDVETAPFRNTATVGIENADATDGAQVAFNTTYIKNGLALRFVKPAVSLTPLISNVTPLSGVVAAGGSRTLTVTLDATELNDGMYYDELVVSSNDPVDTDNTALFELTVIGYPEIEVTPATIEFEPLFVGLSSESSLMIQNTGSKTLEISSISNQEDVFVLDMTGPVTLEPGESQIINVEFTPATASVYEDEIVIVSNDAFGNENLSIPLSGEGVPPPVIEVAPESFELSVTEGESVTETVTISNTGGSTLNYSLTPPYFAKAGEANQVMVQQYEKLEYAKIESKETPDTRVGPKFLNASGGPGTFGYTWIDNNSGGPDYDYIYISTTGELIDVGADGNTTVPLPFDFNFFGNVESSVTIAANGYLTFAPITGVDYVNMQIPDEANPNLFIAALWSDLEPQNGDGVYVQGNEEYFIVQYENVPGWGLPPLVEIPEPVSFQVILFPDGSIKMQYKNVNSTLRTTSTVGLEGPLGLSGLQVIFNTEYLTDELAITFSPPMTGTIEPGETAEIPVTFSAEGLEANQTYSGDITVSSNDPVTPEVLIPVSMEVVESPKIVSFTLIDADSNTEIGNLNEGDIIDLDNYPQSNFSIVAHTGTVEVGSVVFDLNGEVAYHIENIAPYSLNGDFDNATKYYPVEFPIGIHTITATPYSGSNGTGEAGISLTVTFEVIRTTPREVVRFTLIDANTHVEIGALNDGDTIDLDDYSQNSFSLLANVSTAPIGSVVFDLNGEEAYHIENIAPYTLNGDYDNGSKYYPVEFSMGTNTITATPYSEPNGTGEAGIPLTVTFEVIRTNVPEVVSFKLIDTKTNTEVGTLSEGDVINLNDYPSNNFSVVANIGDAEVGSVVFDFNDEMGYTTENIAPFSLNGDFDKRSGGKIEKWYYPVELEIGTNTITATPYFGSNGSGEKGVVLSVCFEVVNGNVNSKFATLTNYSSKNIPDENVEISFYPNPVKDVVNFSLMGNTADLNGIMHNVNGEVVHKALISAKNGLEGSIDMSNLAQGMYILLLTDDNGNLVSQKKIIKE